MRPEADDAPLPLLCYRDNCCCCCCCYYYYYYYCLLLLLLLLLHLRLERGAAFFGVGMR